MISNNQMKTGAVSYIQIFWGDKEDREKSFRSTIKNGNLDF